jgi:hypothetical protein
VGVDYLERFTNPGEWAQKAQRHFQDLLGLDQGAHKQMILMLSYPSDNKAAQYRTTRTAEQVNSV